MSAIITAYRNLLESATVTLTAGTEDISYPLYRLYDRHIGRPFKTTAAVTTDIRIDQGAAGSTAIDRLLIPAGHNLAGAKLDILHSTDNITYTAAVTQWTAAAGVIDKAWSPLTKRYWKFRITTPAATPSIPELFLTSSYAWERQPVRPTSPMDTEFNAISETTSSGAERFLIMGLPRRKRVYGVPRFGAAMQAQMRALYDAWAGAYPFWLCDHEGSWIYGALSAPMQLVEHGPGIYGGTVEFIEVLP